MALSRNEIQKKSDIKRGVKTKGFKLDADTIALFEQAAATTGKPQAAILREALREYAKKHGIRLPESVNGAG